MNWLNGNIIWVLVAVAAAWFLLRRGHGMGGHHGGSRDWRGAPPSDHGGTAHVEAPHAQATAALDPVSGNPVRTDRALTAVYGGRAYYFESEETRKRFEAEPQKYASHEPPPGERPRRRGGC